MQLPEGGRGEGSPNGLREEGPGRETKKSWTSKDKAKSRKF